jgi:hypothetical protein
MRRSRAAKCAMSGHVDDGVRDELMPARCAGYRSILRRKVEKSWP